MKYQVQKYPDGPSESDLKQFAIKLLQDVLAEGTLKAQRDEGYPWCHAKAINEALEELRK